MRWLSQPELKPAGSAPLAKSGAQQLIRLLVDSELSHVFAVPGADIAPLIGALENESQIRTIFATHEFSAGAMADGFARVAGRPSVAISIGGPGASYLTSSAAAAARDGSSVIFITGCPPDGDPEVQSHDGWPDDIRSFLAAGAISLDLSVMHLAADLGAAEELAMANRVIHLRFPVDQQTSIADGDAASTAPIDSVHRVETGVPQSGIDTTLRFGPYPPRLMLAVGLGGLAHVDAISRFSETHGLPVVTNLLARGIISEDSWRSLGHLGFMPNPSAWAATDRNDPRAAQRVVLLGAEPMFEKTVRAGGVDVERIDNQCIARWLRVNQQNVSTCVQERKVWVDQLKRLSIDQESAVQERIDQYITVDPSKLTHRVLMTDTQNALGASAIHVIDAGHFHLVGPGSLVARQPRTVLTGSELVSMGWSIGAAIGAKCAAPDSPVVAYLGDGSFMMHGLELATAARYQIPVLFVVAKNGVYGTAIRGKNSNVGQADLLGPANPARIAEACNVEAIEVSDREQWQKTLQRAASLTRPLVIVANVPETDPSANGQRTGVSWLDAKAK